MKGERGMTRSLLVASGGGHLVELIELRQQARDLGEVVWVTANTPQTRSLLRGERVIHIPDIQPRDYWATAKLWPSARKIVKYVAPDQVISTGASPAVPFLIEAARRRIPARYVESLTRIMAPSSTGRLLAKTPGVRTYTAHEVSWHRWRHLPSPLGVYRAVPDDISGRIQRVDDIKQVVVTVGTTRDYPFRSLIDRLREILPPDADVLWQTGATDLTDLDLEFHPRVDHHDLIKAIENADVVIGHAGCGTALDALRLGKMPVLVPRRTHRNEHVDDHQVEVARWLGSTGLAVAVELSELAPEDLIYAATHRIVADQRGDAVDFAAIDETHSS